MQLALLYNEPDYLTCNPTSRHGTGYTFTWPRPTVEPVCVRCVYGIIRITPNRMIYMHGQTDTRAGKHFNHILPFYLSILRPEKERTTSWYFKWFALPIPNQIKHCHNLLWHQWYASFSHVIVRTWLLSTPNMHLPNAEFIVSRVSHQSYVTCHYIYIYIIYIYEHTHAS